MKDVPNELLAATRETRDPPAIIFAAQTYFMMLMAEELVTLGTGPDHFADRLDAAAASIAAVAGFEEAGGHLRHVAQHLRARFGVKPKLRAVPISGLANESP